MAFHVEICIRSGSGICFFRNNLNLCHSLWHNYRGHIKDYDFQGKDINIAITYTGATQKNGWSVDAREANINSNYHLRLGKADHNFEATLPVPQSDLVVEIIKIYIHRTFIARENNYNPVFL